MNTTKFTTCFLLLSTLSFISCNNDSDKKTHLTGRWEMKYGELNGQPAPALEGMYFQFDDENVTTNFNETATDETIPFEFKESKIIKESNPSVEFDIISLTDSTLEMTTELRGYDFKLVLNHVK